MRRMLSGILGVLAIAVVLVALLALISDVASEEGTSEVGREGQTAIAAEAALSAATSTQNAAMFALILEEGRAEGYIPAEAVAQAAGTLRETNAEFERRVTGLVDRLDTPDEEALVAASGAFIEEMRDLVAVLSEDGVADGPRVTPSDLTAYTVVEEELVSVRDTRVRDVLVVAENVGQVADAVRFLVVVVIPIITILVLRYVFRRRREREALAAELAHQRALSAQKDEFLANLSHELKTPLTGIYGFALALDEDDGQDPETARELTGHLITEDGELARMVDDLITAGQIETGNLGLIVVDVDVDELVMSVVEPYLRTGHHIEVVAGGCTAEADPRRFQQILRSLISNAVRHGGDTIEVFTEYGNGTMSLFVMDDGAGIDEHTRERLFEPYVHDGTEPLLQGSLGLGLAVARTLAEGMDGSLSYTRTNGMTYFVLKLPAHRVSRLNERIEGTDRDHEDGMYDTQRVAKLFSR